MAITTAVAHSNVTAARHTRTAAIKKAIAGGDLQISGRGWVHEPDRRRLYALVEQATVDAYDKYEQPSGFGVATVDHLGPPFQASR